MHRNHVAQNQIEQTTFMPPTLAPIDPHFYVQNTFVPVEPLGTIPMAPASSNGSIQSLPPLSPYYQNPNMMPQIPIVGQPAIYGQENTFAFQVIPPLPPSPMHSLPPSPMQQVPQFVAFPHPIMQQTPSVSPNPAPMHPIMVPTPVLTPSGSVARTPSFHSDISTLPPPPLELENSSSYSHNNNLVVPGMGQPMFFAHSRTPERSPQLTFTSDINAEERFRDRPMTSESVGYEREGHPDEETAPQESRVFKRDPAQSRTYVSDEGRGEKRGQNQQQKKYAYRSKQKKIDRTWRWISEKFSELGLFAAEKELVRGDDCLRVHVKTFLGLKEIVEALTAIPDLGLNIRRIAAVYSKKNKFQHKGLIIYLRLDSVEERERCEEYLHEFENLKQIAVARKKDRNEVKDSGADLGSTNPKDAVTLDLEGFPTPPTRRASIAGS